MYLFRHFEEILETDFISKDWRIIEKKKIVLNVPKIDSTNSDDYVQSKTSSSRESRSIVRKEGEIRLGLDAEDAVLPWFIVKYDRPRDIGSARPFAYLVPLSIAVFVRGHVARIIVRGYK